MIILDTNVLSEPTKANPHPGVIAWLTRQKFETTYVTSVTVAEMLYGATILPAGRRRNLLTDSANTMVRTFSGRILTFDLGAAKQYALLAAAARKTGRGFPTPDGYIAAIAAFHGFIVATRDTAPFQAAGVSTINPWLS